MLISITEEKYQVPWEPKTSRANPAHEVIGVTWEDFKILSSGSIPRACDQIVLEYGSQHLPFSNFPDESNVQKSLRIIAAVQWFSK